jgi:LDH2 family malate/lactate/ureidoglycolate dehydrogenase
MSTILFSDIRRIMTDMFTALGMEKENADMVVDAYLEKSKAGAGHHDIYDLPSRLKGYKMGWMKVNPEFTKLAAFGGMESWDGGNGAGELTCMFAMKRAIALAKESGVGLCTMRNSNHYLASSLYTKIAAEEGCIGIIIAKAGPSMGVPGYKGFILSQSPNGYAFPTGEDWPIVLDGCFAYVSGHGNLNRMHKNGESVPSWWGADSDGNPTTDPEKLRTGYRYPIGEHKGFGYALLCELLTGVMGRGLILDQTEGEDGLKNLTTHTAIAIKADAFMDMDEYLSRSAELLQRIDKRAPGIRFPGQQSHKNAVRSEEAGGLELDDELIEELNECADMLGVARL